MSLTIDISSPDIEKLAKSIEQNNKQFLPMLNNDMKSVAVDVLTMVKTLTPRKTGTTNRQWYMKMLAPLAFVIENDSKIALMLETGTKEHDIKPKHGKALAFAWGKGFETRTGEKASKLKFTGNKAYGGLHSTSLKKYGNSAFTVLKKVHHPGTKAMNIAKNAAEFGSRLLADILSRRAREWKIDL